MAKRWKPTLNNLRRPRRTASTINEDSLAIDDLVKEVHLYLEPQEVEEIRFACLFGAEAHADQRRKSGEPYIIHPLAVARMLAKMRVDKRTVIAAILHDVVEDTEHDLDTIKQHFGEDVAHIVDGVSKVEKLANASKETMEARTFHKMLMASSDDLRVLVIKLFDRLHNMRTLGSLSPEKKQRIAKQTMEIYAPMGYTLGMNLVADELNELAVMNRYPWGYQIIDARIEKSRRGRKPIYQEAIKELQARLDEAGIQCSIHGREKSSGSIYMKMKTRMQGQRQKLKNILDLDGIRIITNSRQDCYQTLGIVHQLYRPDFPYFKDYIAAPKENGYQSIHTKVMGPMHSTIEVQIRTEKMHSIAQQGLAAHWLYKSQSSPDEPSIYDNYKQSIIELLELDPASNNTDEFVDNMKAHFSPKKIYVRTPTGEVKQLPHGATALDFAFSVHSDVGTHSFHAEVNNQRVPLDHVLESSDRVRIITSKKARPVPTWLDFAVTSRARTSIRSYLRKQSDSDKIKLGRSLLLNALQHIGFSRYRIIPKAMKKRLLERLELSNWEALMREISSGTRSADLIAHQLLADDITYNNQPVSKSTMEINGTEGLPVRYATCCRAIPGDDITGLMSNKGDGLVVHRKRCKNVIDINAKHQRYIPLVWSDSPAGNYSTQLRVVATNRPGIIHQITGALLPYEINIEQLNVTSKDQQNSTISLILSVTGRVQLAKLIRICRQLDDIKGCKRVTDHIT